MLINNFIFHFLCREVVSLCRAKYLPPPSIFYGSIMDQMRFLLCLVPPAMTHYRGYVSFHRPKGLVSRHKVFGVNNVKPFGGKGKCLHCSKDCTVANLKPSLPLYRMSASCQILTKYMKILHNLRFCIHGSSRQEKGTGKETLIEKRLRELS